MARREIKSTQERVPKPDQPTDTLDAIIGEIPARDDDEREDDEDTDFDEANEPSGDPGKNVPSA